MVWWTEAALFMLGIELAALYALTVSGNFPAEFRTPEMSKLGGTVILWTTLVLTALAAILTLAVGARTLPWYALVIGAGIALLFAPLLLRAVPDRFVNGRAGLLAFSAAALGAAITLWAAA